MPCDRPRDAGRGGADPPAGSSPALIARATRLLDQLGVVVRTNAAIAGATAEGFTLKGGETIAGGVFVWAGGVKANGVVVGSGLPIGHNGRVKVDRYLRALDRPEIYVPLSRKTHP